MMHSSQAKLGIVEVSWVHFPKFLKYLIYKAMWRNLKNKKSYQGNICLLWKCYPRLHRKLEHRNCDSGFGGKESKYIQGSSFCFAHLGFQIMLFVTVIWRGKYFCSFKTSLYETELLSYSLLRYVRENRNMFLGVENAPFLGILSFEIFL